MARGKDLYVGSTLVHHIYSEGTKVYHIYKDGAEIWRDRHYNADETVYQQSVGGNYTVNIADDGVYRITCIGAGGRAVYTAVYDDRGYLATAGSGAGFIGEVELTRGTYAIQVGSAAVGGARNSYITGIVSVGGGGDGVARLSAGAGGSAPVLSVTATNITLNTAGNAGSAGTGGKGSSIPPVNLLGGASVYETYGRGGGGQASEYWQACYANDRGNYIPTDGFIKFEYLRDLQS